MKFVIENLSKSSGRLGYLVHAETGTQLKTPLLLQTTKGGSIPYLSREVFDYVTKEPQILQLTLSTMDQMAESVKLFHGSVDAYVGYKGYPNMLQIRDPCELTPSGSNDKDMVPLFTRRGRETLTGQRYMELVELFAPVLYQGLCDADTNIESSKKRVQKSVDRTEQFMNYCYEHHKQSKKLKQHSTMFAPIVGGYNTYARTQSIKHARTNGENIYGGYILEGFHNYGLSATNLDAENLLNITTHCLKEMEENKPKLMPGAYTPLITLQLIGLGIDMFDTSYAYCAAVNFKALTFSFDLNATENLAAHLDLTDDSLKEDFSPFMKNCSCLACSKHTRAYVHHLYKTNELLGPILLMIHNLHHYIQFFVTIRNCIALDKLNDLVKLIEYQNSDKPVDYRIYENTKVISKIGMGKGFVAPPTNNESK